MRWTTCAKPLIIARSAGDVVLFRITPRPSRTMKGRLQYPFSTRSPRSA
jgi:hypothetical protein